MRFVTIGYIEWRKGQDILIDAIERLPRDIVASSEFMLIGQNSSLMARQLAERTASMANVTMTGTMPREEIPLQRRPDAYSMCRGNDA